MCVWLGVDYLLQLHLGSPFWYQREKIKRLVGGQWTTAPGKRKKAKMEICIFGETIKSFDSAFISSTITTYWFRVFGFTVKIRCGQVTGEKVFHVLMYHGISDEDAYVFIGSAQKTTVADAEDFIQSMITTYSKA